MARTLLVTNDFPPTIGGIQSYLRDFVDTIDPSEIVVFASTQDAEAAALFDSAQPYTVVRWPHKVMLPTPATAREMQRLVRSTASSMCGLAQQPLGADGQSGQRGAHKVVATTHGHEVGWSMLPLARQALHEIGRHADVITYISDYTLRRLTAPFGPGPRWVHLPSAVSLEDFSPADAASNKLRELILTFLKDQLLPAFPALFPAKGRTSCCVRFRRYGSVSPMPNYSS